MAPRVPNVPPEKAALAVVDEVLRLARKIPGAEAMAGASFTRRAFTRFGASEITATGDAEDNGISVTIALGTRHASVSLNQTDPASLATAVDRAARLARLSPEDPEWMPVLGPQKYATVPSALDPGVVALGAPARAEAVGQTLAAGQQAGVQVAGFYQHSAEATAMGTSAGLRASHSDTDVSFSVTARTADGTGSGWAGDKGFRHADIDAARVSRVAIEKAVRSKNPRKLDPGRYTVILEPAAASELLGFFTESLDARSADEGRSFFSAKGGGTRVGEQLFPESVTIRRDPADPALPSWPYDGDGLPRPTLSCVERGKLNGLFYSRFWAQKKGKPAIGGGGPFALAPGTASDEDLIKGCERGVLITHLWYTRWVDPQSILITGLTRDGVFLIEKGEIVAPVNNFRFNESPVVMLKNVDAMTQKTRFAPLIGGNESRVPAIRTHEFNLASVSEAV